MKEVDQLDEKPKRFSKAFKITFLVLLITGILLVTVALLWALLFGPWPSKPVEIISLPVNVPETTESPSPLIQAFESVKLTIGHSRPEAHPQDKDELAKDKAPSKEDRKKLHHIHQKPSFAFDDNHWNSVSFESTDTNENTLGAKIPVKNEVHSVYTPKDPVSNRVKEVISPANFSNPSNTVHSNYLLTSPTLPHKEIKKESKHVLALKKQTGSNKWAATTSSIISPSIKQNPPTARLANSDALGTTTSLPTTSPIYTSSNKSKTDAPVSKTGIASAGKAPAPTHSPRESQVSTDSQTKKIPAEEMTTTSPIQEDGDIFGSGLYNILRDFGLPIFEVDPHGSTHNSAPLAPPDKPREIEREGTPQKPELDMEELVFPAIKSIFKELEDNMREAERMTVKHFPGHPDMLPLLEQPEINEFPIFSGLW